MQILQEQPLLLAGSKRLNLNLTKHVCILAGLAHTSLQGNPLKASDSKHFDAQQLAHAAQNRRGHCITVVAGHILRQA